VSGGFDDLARLAQDLDRAGATAGRQARGIVAKGVDRAAVQAKQQARAVWTKSGSYRSGGREPGASAESIRARMDTHVGSRGGLTQVGYVFVDGGGAFQESGTGHHPPNPVLGAAVEAQTDFVADLLANLDVL
jgi:hypothetical protein